jgi:hypothetical protein
MTRRPTDREMLNDDVHTGDYYTEQYDAHGTISIQHCDAPTTTHATISDDRTAFILAGRAPQQEEGTPETCARLAETLTRRDGEAWTVEAKDKVSRPQGDADGYLRRESEDQPVPVQVTRAGKWERWRLLNTTGSAAETIQRALAAEEVWKAIANKSTTPDAAMILAVRGLPGIHTTQTVVDELRRIHGPELDRLRYREIWLIGSSPDTHFCLRPL